MTSWSEGKQNSLDLFIESRGGFTRELLSHCKVNGYGTSSRLVLFSGPHEISMPVGEYESVLMIASGFGIAAQLPYLKQPDLRIQCLQDSHLSSPFGLEIADPR